MLKFLSFLLFVSLAACESTEFCDMNYGGDCALERISGNENAQSISLPPPSAREEEEVVELVEELPDNVEVIVESPRIPPDANAGIIFTDTLFAFESAELTAEFKKSLDKAGAYLTSKKIVKLEIRGHTDFIGRASFNLGLSERRADAVRAFLLSKGHLPSVEIKAVGFGESKPVATNLTDLGRSKNRRVELFFVLN